MPKWLTGAITGAAAGAPLGPWGILGGAALGGIGAEMSGDERKKAEEMVGPNPYEAFYQGPQGFGQRVQDAQNAEYLALAQQQAMGQNLLAPRLVADAIGKANSAQRSAAAAARPGMGGSASRIAAQTIGQQQADAARQAGLLGMQEQRQAGEFLANQQRNLMKLEMQAAGGMADSDLARQQLLLNALKNERATGDFNQLMGALAGFGQAGAAGAFNWGNGDSLSGDTKNSLKWGMSGPSNWSGSV